MWLHTLKDSHSVCTVLKENIFCNFLHVKSHDFECKEKCVCFFYLQPSTNLCLRPFKAGSCWKNLLLWRREGLLRPRCRWEAWGFFQVIFCIFHFDFIPFFKDLFMFFLFNSCFTVFTTTWVSLCFCFVFIWKMNIGAFFPPWDAQTRGFWNLSLFLFSLLSTLSLVKNLYSVKAEGLNSIQFNSI